MPVRRKTARKAASSSSCGKAASIRRSGRHKNPPPYYRPGPCGRDFEETWRSKPGPLTGLVMYVPYRGQMGGDEGDLLRDAANNHWVLRWRGRIGNMSMWASHAHASTRARAGARTNAHARTHTHSHTGGEGYGRYITQRPCTTTQCSLRGCGS